MEYKVGDIIELCLVVGSDRKYNYEIASIIRGKRSLLSIETDLYEVKIYGSSAGKVIKSEIDSWIKEYNGKIISKEMGDMRTYQSLF